MQVQIRYVSRVDNKQQCTVWLGSFKADREFFKEPVKVQVEGSEACLSLMSPGEVRACCNSDVSHYSILSSVLFVAVAFSCASGPIGMAICTKGNQVAMGIIHCCCTACASSVEVCMRVLDWLSCPREFG